MALPQKCSRVFRRANDHAVFAAAWLDAIASLTDGMQQGLVVLAALRGGRNEPVASWPSKVVPEGALLAVVDGAVRGGRMVLQTVDPRKGTADASPLLAIGYPVSVGGRVRGAAGLLVASGGENPRTVIDRIAWGCGWIEALLRRRTVSLGDRIGTVVELLATGLHHDRFQEAATSVATELAGVFGCERVSIGFLNRRPRQARRSLQQRRFWQEGEPRPRHRIGDGGGDRSAGDHRHSHA